MLPELWSKAMGEMSKNWFDSQKLHLDSFTVFVVATRKRLLLRPSSSFSLVSSIAPSFLARSAPPPSSGVRPVCGASSPLTSAAASLASSSLRGTSVQFQLHCARSSPPSCGDDELVFVLRLLLLLLLLLLSDEDDESLSSSDDEEEESESSEDELLSLSSSESLLSEDDESSSLLSLSFPAFDFFFLLALLFFFSYFFHRFIASSRLIKSGGFSVLVGRRSGFFRIFERETRRW
mmetsp:Transcript_29726/g.41323  ORF Transcript_29726/g.41323 Transcript_29726/m.41323 type:complete len:235 (+) Transcript_29726:100-804(+)